MTQSNRQTLQPLTVLKALKAGFELTTKCWWLLIIPVLLDTFLWLGPRVRFGSIFNNLLQQLLAMPGVDEAAIPVEQATALADLVDETNLFAALATPVHGVPSLMSRFLGDETPIQPTEWLLETPQIGLIVSLVLLLVGLCVTGVYFLLIVHALDEESRWQHLLRRLPTAGLGMLALGMVIYLVFVLWLLLLLLVSSYIGIVFLPLAFALIIGGLVFVMWGLVFTGFAPHALLIAGESPLRALRTSMRFTRSYLGLVLPLLLIVWIVRGQLSQIWLRADNGSWLTFVSILGHAFIATALVSSTFIFYKEYAVSSAEAA